MKVMLAISLTAIALVGCNASQPPVQSAAGDKSAGVSATRVVNFVGPMDLTIRLQSSDNFETAVMTDNADRSFNMTRVPAASGLRMSDGKSTFIHFKNGEGIVEFVKDRPIRIKEFAK
ncbi:hypothetical protein [Comamonas sp. C24C]